MAYDIPIGFTPNFNIALFGEDSNPGAAQLNTNWQIIDEALLNLGIGPEDDLEINNLIVNGSLRAFEFIINQVKTVQGGQIISSANGKIKSIAYNQTTPIITIETTPGDLATSFALDDIVLIQRYGLDGSTIIKQLFCKVGAIQFNQLTLVPGSSPTGTGYSNVGNLDIGDVVLQIGNESDPMRRASIFVSVSNGKPKIIVKDDVQYVEDWNDPAVIKTILGNLENYQFEGSALSGYGIVSHQLFIGNKNQIKASQITDDGIWGKAEDVESNCQLLENLSDDSKLIPFERFLAINQWRIIEDEQPGIIAEANRHGVSTTNYETAYTELFNYLEYSLDIFTPSDPTATINIVKETWDLKWDQYYFQRSVLYNSMLQTIGTKQGIKTFIQSEDPSISNTMTAGDLWIETDNLNKMWRWNGTSWKDATAQLSNGTTTISDGMINSDFINALDITAKSVVSSWIYTGTLIGNVIKTSTSGARAELTSEGLRIYPESKFGASAIEWFDGENKVFSIGVEIDLGAVTGTYIDTFGTGLNLSHTLNIGEDLNVTGNCYLAGNIRINGNLNFDGLQNVNSITTLVNRDSLNTQLPTALAVYNALNASGGNGYSDWNLFINGTKRKDVVNDSNVKFSQTSGLSISWDETSEEITFGHSNTSSQSSVENSGANIIQSITLDNFGHVTGIESKELTLSDFGAAASSHSHDNYNKRLLYALVNVSSATDNAVPTQSILNQRSTYYGTKILIPYRYKTGDLKIRFSGELKIQGGTAYIQLMVNDTPYISYYTTSTAYITFSETWDITELNDEEIYQLSVQMKCASTSYTASLKNVFIEIE